MGTEYRARLRNIRYEDNDSADRRDIRPVLDSDAGAAPGYAGGPVRPAIRDSVSERCESEAGPRLHEGELVDTEHIRSGTAVMPIAPTARGREQQLPCPCGTCTELPSLAGHNNGASRIELTQQPRGASSE